MAPTIRNLTAMTVNAADVKHTIDSALQEIKNVVTHNLQLGQPYAFFPLQNSLAETLNNLNTSYDVNIVAKIIHSAKSHDEVRRQTLANRDIRDAVMARQALVSLSSLDIADRAVATQNYANVLPADVYFNAKKLEAQAAKANVLINAMEEAARDVTIHKSYGRDVVEQYRSSTQSDEKIDFVESYKGHMAGSRAFITRNRPTGFKIGGRRANLAAGVPLTTSTVARGSVHRHMLRRSHQASTASARAPMRGTKRATEQEDSQVENIDGQRKRRKTEANSLLPLHQQDRSDRPALMPAKDEGTDGMAKEGPRRSMNSATGPSKMPNTSTSVESLTVRPSGLAKMAAEVVRSAQPTKSTPSLRLVSCNI